jgi:hypothetical protein
MVFRKVEKMNKVIARFIDGRIIKGNTVDFSPGRDVFHVSLADALPGDKPVAILTNALKAVFFVKDMAGDPKHVATNEFDPSRPCAGRKIKVVFRDGEVLVGITTGYQPGRPGFFLVPADTCSNNERCYVVTAFAKEINFI